MRLTFFISGTLCLFSLNPAQAEPDIPRPQRLIPGLEWIRWNGDSLCRAGDPGIGVLIVNPEQLRFEILHYQLEAESGPLTIWEWYERSQPYALFNPGQYYPDYSYMGMLIIQGQSIRRRIHGDYKALFMTEPVSRDDPKAKITDLARDVFDPQRPGYLNVAQSFMLLDRFGAIRVRRTLNVANRTAVAEGPDGTIWIFVTQGGYTLWEFGQLLRSSPFALRQAMSMDGGSEAQMLVKVEGFLFDNLGTWDETRRNGRPGSRIRRPLPTVIGVFPRED